jgi:hypothetical protein
VRLSQTRENVFTITATSQELSALIAGAKMALDMMQHDDRAPREAITLLTGVLRDYDRALGYTKTGGERSERPTPDSPDA